MKIDDKYKWLARDEDGELWAYTERPSKISDVFWDVAEDVEYYSTVVYEEDETYSFIKWERENPMTVGDVEEQLKFNEYLSNKKESGEVKDNINKPTHYHSGNIDVIKFSEENFSKEEQKGFHRINAIKYITRYDKKGTPLEDLKKAKFYIDKLIELEEHESIPKKPTNDPLQDFLTALRNTKVVTDNSDAKIATFYHGYNPLD